jgi:hypothetical protein
MVRVQPSCSFPNTFRIHKEQCVQSLLVKNYGLNTKQHCFLITAVLYRVLSLNRNVFKLVPYKKKRVRALTSSYKLRTSRYTALFPNSGSIIQGVKFQINVFKLVPYRREHVKKEKCVQTHIVTN